MKQPTLGPARPGARGVRVLLISLVLAGCASPGDVKTSATLRTPESIAARHSLAGGARRSAAWPQERWWRRYGDPQLDGLVDEALRGSPTLAIAEARVRQAGAAVALASSTASPQVGGSLKSTRQQYSGNSIVPRPLAGNWAWYNEASLGFAYEFDFWGRNRAAVEAAAGRASAAEADAQAARLALAVAVVRSYMDLQHAYRQLDLAEAALASRGRIAFITRQRVAAQLDSAVELKQAELALPAAREQIAQIRESIALLRMQLAALAGQGPDRGLAIARPQAGAAAPATLPSSLPAALLGRRPDVVAQRWRVEALAQDIALSRARFFPDVNLLAFAGLQSLGFASFLDAGSRIAGAGPALTLPIFDGGRLRAGLAQRSAEYDAAVEQYNQTLVAAVRDVASQVSSLQWLDERRQQQAQALKLAEGAHRLALERFRAGVGNFLQVLIVENQWLAQQRAQNDLDARALDLDIALIRALGGGYRGDAPGAPAAAALSLSNEGHHEQAY